MIESILYEKLSKKTVMCKTCRHYCKIANGKTGICRIRKNIDGILKLRFFDETTGASIDPIEKKPLFHFHPGKKCFSFGTISCNFGCKFCQNAWMSMPLSDNNIDMPAMYKLSPEEIIQYCLKNNVKIIAYTFNEPTIFFEYAYQTAVLAKENQINNIFVTNGYLSREGLDIISPYLDGANIDLKSFSEKFYQKICKAKLSNVLDSIKDHYKKKIWIELTTLLIPGENDSRQEIKDIAQFIVSLSKSIPWHITIFRPEYKMLDHEITSDNKIQEAYEIAKSEGLEFVYAGNTYLDTICPKCNNLLIQRHYFETSIINIRNGKCKFCSKKIPGIF